MCKIPHDTVQALVYLNHCSFYTEAEFVLHKDRTHPHYAYLHIHTFTIDPFTVYVTGKFEVRSAHVGVRKFIPSH